MNYIGDLNEESALTLPRPAAGVGIRYRLDNRWALRLEASYGQIGCDEDYNELRNLSFRSDILEGALLAEFNFAPFGSGATERLWTPYLFGGLGVFHFNPMAQYTLGDGEVHWAELQPLCTEGQGSTLYPDRKGLPPVCSSACLSGWASRCGSARSSRWRRNTGSGKRGPTTWTMSARPMWAATVLLSNSTTGPWRPVGRPQRRGGAWLCQRRGHQTRRRLARRLVRLPPRLAGHQFRRDVRMDAV